MMKRQREKKQSSREMFVETYDEKVKTDKKDHIKQSETTDPGGGLH